MASRVVPGISETIARSSPSSALSRLDLPTFGRPMKAIAAGSPSASAAIAASQRRASASVPSADRRRRRRLLVARRRRSRRTARGARRPPRRPRRRPPPRAPCARARPRSRAAAPRRSRRAGRRSRGRARPRSRRSPPSRASGTRRPRARASRCRPCWPRRSPAPWPGAGCAAASRSAGVRPLIASTRNRITSASAMARRACSWTRASIWSSGLELETAGVDDDEAPAVPLGVAVQPVARRPRPVLDDRRALAEEPVEERALADVRAPDDGDDRDPAPSAGHGQAAPEATPVRAGSVGSEVVRPAGVAARSRAA